MEKRKDWKMISIRMDVHVLNRLDAYCEKTGLARTKAMERILSISLHLSSASSISSIKACSFFFSYGYLPM